MCREKGGGDPNNTYFSSKRRKDAHKVAKEPKYFFVLEKQKIMFQEYVD